MVSQAQKHAWQVWFGSVLQIRPNEDFWQVWSIAGSSHHEFVLQIPALKQRPPGHAGATNRSVHAFVLLVFGRQSLQQVPGWPPMSCLSCWGDTTSTPHRSPQLHNQVPQKNAAAEVMQMPNLLNMSASF
jgi:hypothetical protein